MIVLPLICSTFWVDVELREINGRWIASADTPDGPGGSSSTNAAFEPGSWRASLAV